MGIICSCLPTLKAPAKSFFPRLWSSRHKTTGAEIDLQPITTTNAYSKGVKSRSDQKEWETTLEGSKINEPMPNRAYMTTRAKRQSRDMNLDGLEGAANGIMVFTSIDQEFEPAVEQSAMSEQGSTWQAFEESGKSEHGSTRELVDRRLSYEEVVQQ